MRKPSWTPAAVIRRRAPWRSFVDLHAAAGATSGAGETTMATTNPRWSNDVGVKRR